ncbi:hypothetical protein ACSBR1_040139 [Camellia fascicularis]
MSSQMTSQSLGLSACSHGGFVDKGLYYFEAVIRCYGLTLGLNTVGAWLIFLVGQTFRSHGNVELAEFAANKIEELEPRKCGARVLLSNVYASASRWTHVKMGKGKTCSFMEPKTTRMLFS